MVDILIYNTENYLDSLSQPEIDNLNTELSNIYNSRLLKGDILEIRPYGYFSNKGFNKNKFAVLEIDDVEYDNIKHYADPEFENENLKHQKKYNIDISELEINETKKIKIKMNKLKLKDKSWPK